MLAFSVSNSVLYKVIQCHDIIIVQVHVHDIVHSGEG